MLEQLSDWYRSICICLPELGAALGIVVGKVRRRVYRLALSWDKIVELYSCACLVVLLLSLVWYYMCVAYRMMAARQRNIILFTDVVRYLFKEDEEEDE
ncbi:uncharacterized protein LOC111605184 [Drosophila hydei]|uniref:Uncharacterized protein LOC111605184 n=1 Tax=Drosophila hydei TaxID=7224 RepID=A0A6J1MJL7_DROHY|nr:uncharacterized protein LOC111605184 [Drosophila hydei]